MPRVARSASTLRGRIAAVLRRADGRVAGALDGVEALAPAAFAALLASVVVALRLPALFNRALNGDEIYYAVGAARLLDGGGVFYRDVVDHKPPGIYWIYAALFQLTGARRLAGIHAALIAVVLATALALARIGEGLRDRRAGRAAGLLYAVTSAVGPAGDFLAANCELFMNLPAVLAVCLLLAPLRAAGGAGAGGAGAGGAGAGAGAGAGGLSGARLRHLELRALGAGALLAVAVLIKVQAAAIAGPLVHRILTAPGGAAAADVTGHRGRVPARAWALGATALGAAAPLLALLTGYAAAGALGDLWWAFRYGSGTYIKALAPAEKLVNGLRNSALIALMWTPLLAAAAAFLARAHRGSGRERASAGLLLGWLALAFAALSFGGRFYPHYFLQLLPPLVLLAGQGIAARGGRTRRLAR